MQSNVKCMGIYLLQRKERKFIWKYSKEIRSKYHVVILSAKKRGENSYGNKQCKIRIKYSNAKLRMVNQSFKSNVFPLMNKANVFCGISIGIEIAIIYVQSLKRFTEGGDVIIWHYIYLCKN